MQGFIAFVDEFVTGSIRNVLFTAFGCAVEVVLAFIEPINYLCLAFGLWFGVLFILNAYSWDYQRRHNIEETE